MHFQSKSDLHFRIFKSPILNINSLFPQNSRFHSQLSIFPLELSFSALKNFFGKSHSRSRLSVYLLSQKSDCNQAMFHMVLSNVLQHFSSALFCFENAYLCSAKYTGLYLKKMSNFLVIK